MRQSLGAFLPEMMGVCVVGFIISDGLIHAALTDWATVHQMLLELLGQPGCFPLFFWSEQMVFTFCLSSCLLSVVRCEAVAQSNNKLISLGVRQQNIAPCYTNTNQSRLNKGIHSLHLVQANHTSALKTLMYAC